jgi:hypothetical protein
MSDLSLMPMYKLSKKEPLELPIFQRSSIIRVFESMNGTHEEADDDIKQRLEQNDREGLQELLICASSIVGSGARETANTNTLAPGLHMRLRRCAVAPQHC